MTIALRNLYEDLIDGMMIEEVSGIDTELKALLQNAPIEKKRSLILTALVENNVEHRLLGNKIQKMVENNTLYSARHIKNVVKMLREYVEVSAIEKKTLGEVMTPTSLVTDMLDTLPKEVWSNPDLKWLDPCNGVGIFPAVIIDRLMDGLIEVEPNEELRYKHIMENMIYISELQAKNVFLYLYAFDPEDRFTLNVYCGSSLDEGFDNHMDFWDVDKFDVVVMNPPYQVQKEGNRKTQTLWDKFVIKSINNLIDGGYLVAVHPSSWRDIKGMYKNIQTLLKSKQITYLEIHNKKDGIKTFGAETRYDFYCLHNVPNTMFTKIKCQDGTIECIDLSKMEFIPNGMYSKLQNLLPKNGEETVTIISDSSYHTQRPHLSEEQTNEFKYPVVYRVRKDESLDFWYSNTNEKGHFGISKLIWSDGRVTSVGSYIDKNGDYALNQFQFAIVDDANVLNKIKKAFDSDKFRNLMLECEVSNMSINRKVIATFRKDFWKEFI